MTGPSRTSRRIAPSRLTPLSLTLQTGVGDVILFWNAVALEANRVSHTQDPKEQAGPVLSARALAIVHLAMYDAYAGVVNDPANLPPYFVGNGVPAPPAGATKEAATAGAAHRALSVLFPSQQAFFDAKLAEADVALQTGFGYGAMVADALLADRAADPTASSLGYTAPTGRGKHRPDPDNPDQGLYAPLYGAACKGFAVTDRHGISPPPFDDAEYVKALREVRGKGIAPTLMGTLTNNLAPRTVDETLIGIFWGYDGAAKLGTPPRLYNQIVRVVAEEQGNTEAENARLFALVNVAMADAGMLAWDQKYLYNLWRPVIGIREHDKSMGEGGTPTDNISNDTDTGWLPLGAPATNSANLPFTQAMSGYPCAHEIAGRVKNFTPPFPAYPSGHATFGAAALYITRLFYGITDRKPDQLFKSLKFVSEELNGVNRDNTGTIRPRHERAFPGGLWQMIEENGRSRVYLGVHWVFDAFAVKNNGDPDLSRNVGGIPLGLTVAEDIFNGGREKGMKKSAVGPRP